jgi:hypothetical protein
MIIPLARRHTLQRGETAGRKLDFHFDDPSATLFGRPRTNAHPSVHIDLPPPYSPDFAIVNFYLFGPFKQQLSGGILDSEQNVLETVIAILKEFPKDEVQSAFCIRRKDASASRTIAENSVRVSSILRYRVPINALS